MVLAGLAFCLTGGCPGHQLFLAGEGDGDAAAFILGMMVGAAFSHNFGLASSPSKLDNIRVRRKTYGKISSIRQNDDCVVVHLRNGESLLGGNQDGNR
jgi:uncharacterized membrane protein YedE/YeeE